MTSCEQKLFDFRVWDEVCEGTTMFMDCKLNEEVGEFQAGSVFSSITIDGTNGVIILEDQHGLTHQYELQYQAGKKLDTERPADYDD